MWQGPPSLKRKSSPCCSVNSREQESCREQTLGWVEEDAWWWLETWWFVPAECFKPGKLSVLGGRRQVTVRTGANTTEECFCWVTVTWASMLSLVCPLSSETAMHHERGACSHTVRTFYCWHTLARYPLLPVAGGWFMLCGNSGFLISSLERRDIHLWK